MAKFLLVALLGNLLLASSYAHAGHRHLLQDETVAAADAPFTDVDFTYPPGVRDPFDTDRTPGPVEHDPSQMGMRGGYYRCAQSTHGCIVLVGLASRA